MPFSPSTTSSTDPFTTVYQAIYNGLKGFADFAAIVQLANLIHFDALANPLKDKRDASALPEVTLSQGDFKLAPFGQNSLAAGIQQSYPLIATEADLNIIPTNQVKYQTLRALTALGGNLGVSYVTKYTISNGRDMPNSSAPNRGIDRWQSILQINVEMMINKPLFSI